jgi:actin related protein 2/3 complex subunit 3
VLFRKFEVKGPADKLLVYLALYINMALKRIEACKTEADGVKAIISLGLEKFPIPGEPGFPLGGLFTAPQTKDEGGSLFFCKFIAKSLPMVEHVFGWMCSW